VSRYVLCYRCFCAFPLFHPNSSSSAGPGAAYPMIPPTEVLGNLGKWKTLLSFDKEASLNSLSYWNADTKILLLRYRSGSLRNRCSISGTEFGFGKTNVRV